MWTTAKVQELIKTEGLQKTLMVLTDDNFPENAKEQLSKDYLFVGGYPNLELLYTLV